MIDFIELNESQKNYVVYVMKRFKHDRDEISLIEMKSYHETMVHERDKGGPKFGYPNWLIDPENKVSKSVYQFPRPSGEALEAFHRGDVAPQIKLEKYSPMLQEVVKNYGLL